MTARLKRRFIAGAAILLVASGFALGWRARGKAFTNRGGAVGAIPAGDCGQPIAGQFLAVQNMLKVMARAEEGKRTQKTVMAERDANKGAKDRRPRQDGEGASVDGEASLNIPEDCADCFSRYRREVEVKDDSSYWTYRDPDALDDEPGALDFSPRFFMDMAEAASPGRTPPDSPPSDKLAVGRPELSARGMVTLAGYEAELSYSPLVIEGEKGAVSVVLESRVEMNRATQVITGGAGAGIEVRW